MLALAAAAPDAAAQKRAAPLPFTYLGTLDQGGERYAVLAARDQSVLLVRTGETIGSEYRVQSIAEEQLLLVNLASGAVQALVRDASPAPQNASAPPPNVSVALPPQLPEAPEEAGTAASPSEPAAEGARPGYAH
ncbi:MAG TPA: hypothetical protein VFB93_05575 [Burkholderiales bacterium]|nr:hypothetical protein [Burkholderiales bacterium]